MYACSLLLLFACICLTVLNDAFTLNSNWVAFTFIADFRTPCAGPWQQAFPHASKLYFNEIIYYVHCCSKHLSIFFSTLVVWKSHFKYLLVRLSFTHSLSVSIFFYPYLLLCVCIVSVCVFTFQKPKQEIQELNLLSHSKSNVIKYWEKFSHLDVTSLALKHWITYHLRILLLFQIYFSSAV